MMAPQNHAGPLRPSQSCIGMPSSSDDLKARGNAAFNSGYFFEAIKLFSAAIELDPTSHALYSNRSACYASTSDFKSGLSDAKRCVELNPQWAKGYSRLGACYWGLKEWLLCANSYSKGLQLDPDNDAMRKALEEARSKIRESRKSSAPKDPDQSNNHSYHRTCPPPPRQPSPVKTKEGKRKGKGNPGSKRPLANKKPRNDDKYEEDFINDDPSSDGGDEIEEKEEEEMVVEEEDEDEGESEDVEAAMKREVGDSDEEGDEEESLYSSFYRTKGR